MTEETVWKLALDRRRVKFIERKEERGRVAQGDIATENEEEEEEGRKNKRLEGREGILPLM